MNLDDLKKSLGQVFANLKLPGIVEMLEQLVKAIAEPIAIQAVNAALAAAGPIGVAMTVPVDFAAKAGMDAALDAGAKALEKFPVFAPAPVDPDAAKRAELTAQLQALQAQLGAMGRK